MRARRSFLNGVILGLTVGLIAAVVGVAFPGEQDTLISAFSKLAPSVGALYAQTEEGSLAFNCTVTAVDRTSNGDTLVLTARHCVSKGTSYLVSFNGREMHPARVYKLPKEEIDPQAHRRRYNEPAVDMALFAVSGANVPLTTLGSDANARPGTRVLVVGFPLGVAKINYEGLVAGRLNRPGADNDGYLLLQSWGAPGSSGSAVVDATSGEVIGVLVAGKQGAIGLPVIFATPISYQSYLREVGE